MADVSAGPPPADPHGQVRSGQLAALAWVCLALLACAYAFFVLTAAGQRLDTEGFLGRLAASPDARDLLARALHLIDVVTLVAMLGLVVTIGLVRRRWRLALTAAAAYVGAVVGSQLLKSVLPWHDLVPDLDDLLHGKHFDTYPSGHATITTGFVLALVLVSRNTWRPVLAVVGVLWSSVLAAGTVTAGWHRPSDAIGGILLAGAFMAGGAAVLARREAEAVPAARTSEVVPFGMVLVLVLAVSGLALNRVDAGIADLPVDVPLWVYPAAQLVIDVAAVGVVGTYAWLLRDVRFGGRHDEDDPDRSAPA